MAEPASKPLSGILVVALEQAVAAPVCTARLADAGARVIKVERPEGDFARSYDDFVHGEATYFVWANRGKESICLDLRSPDDLALMERMIARADVFVQNLAVGAAARLGLNADELRARFPRLITCAISGYGEDGPNSGMKAYDLLIQAESGLSSINGGNRVGVSLADIVTGINAHGAILESLVQRAQTGCGSHVSLSLFDSLADLMAVPLLQQSYAGFAPENIGMHHPSITPYGGYPTRDGVDVVIAIQNEREWTRLCVQVLAMPELVDDPRFSGNRARTHNRALLEPVIRQVTGGMALGALVAKLSSAGIAFGRINELADVLTHASLRRVPVVLPDGSKAEIPAPPAKAQWGADDAGAVPALGQHGAALRDEFSDTRSDGR